MIGDAANRLFHLIKTGCRPNAARLSRWRGLASDIVRMSQDFRALGENELVRRGLDIRWRAKSGIPLVKLMPEAYALVIEASRRTTGLIHYPVQIVGAIGLFEGGIAEMQTGEGKTLTATLPTFLFALQGAGCHVVTVNDYLAERDCEKMAPIYRLLGLTVGCIQTPMTPPQRKEAYQQDITYATAKELGFDFLRDRLKRGGAERKGQLKLGDSGDEDEGIVQRGCHFALIDEADSILIDEARTPLIIALNQPNDSATVNLYRWSDRAIQALSLGSDFLYEPDKRQAFLTDAGCRKILLMGKPSLLDTIDTERIYKQIEQSLVARYGFHKDRDYVIAENKEITIVDESTGRMMEGRRWQDGLHQAIEAKEMVPITASTGQAARITVQSYFREYKYLAGMTGTAFQVHRELNRVYGLKVTVIPTHRNCIRRPIPARVFKTLDAKNRAVAEAIMRAREQGRSVLVGTPSVEKSELLGSVLKEMGIPHHILNAKYHAQEAEIVTQAGQAQKVTIATNMAGRGTDIILDEAVKQSGGLHVIATEMHSSKRIDRQLVGRSARQGDPGTYQFFLSLEDELLRCLSPRRRQSAMRRAMADSKGELSSSWLTYFQRTQRFLEKMHGKQRRDVLKREQYRTEYSTKMGMDPFLEMTD
jgi:preprotein translocase subunit SecA